MLEVSKAKYDGQPDLSSRCESRIVVEGGKRGAEVLPSFRFRK